MKVVLSLMLILFSSSLALAQSGRRPKEIKPPVPPAVPETPESNNARPELAVTDRATSVTAERNQDYRCSDDGTLERLLDTSDGSKDRGDPSGPGRILTEKESDTRVEITSKPQPSYTKEARRLGLQGFVALKVLLSGNGSVGRVRVVKGLRAGLTESAIRAACKMKFKPALKDGEPVSQWVIAEYLFRLADSSIFRP
jgi:protein TonB